MNFGTTTYGSTAIGGAAASPWFVFFVFLLREPDIVFTSTLTYDSTGMFSVFMRQGSEVVSNTSGVIYKIYSANDPHETPQLQTTQEGDGQAVIGAAHFITVTAEVNGAIWGGGQLFEVRGRAGD